MPPPTIMMSGWILWSWARKRTVLILPPLWGERKKSGTERGGACWRYWDEESPLRSTHAGVRWGSRRTRRSEDLCIFHVSERGSGE
jgi:hypothetical protein